jgi:hypothetical protein
MNEQRTRTRYIPPAPGPAKHDPANVDSRGEASKSPAFREALRKDDEREARSDFHKDRDMWGRAGPGPDVAKTDPEKSQEREEGRARREGGYD